jgi:hypothetical protein
MRSPPPGPDDPTCSRLGSRTGSAATPLLGMTCVANTARGRAPEMSAPLRPPEKVPPTGNVFAAGRWALRCRRESSRVPSPLRSGRQAIGEGTEVAVTLSRGGGWPASRYRVSGEARQRAGAWATWMDLFAECVLCTVSRPPDLARVGPPHLRAHRNSVNLPRSHQPTPRPPLPRPVPHFTRPTAATSVAPVAGRSAWPRSSRE